MRIFSNRSSLAPPPQAGLAWELFEAFLIARDAFLEIYDTYEDLVMSFATSRGVDRLVLRLSATELSGLLDFRKLEELREAHLASLKELSHQLFRKAENTDPLDRILSESFHELSILKEEQYKLLTFASSYKGAEIESFLDEVHHAFPARVHRIHDLFQGALDRLLALLPEPIFREDRIFLRSLYLFGEELLQDRFTESLDDFWERIFTKGRAPEGFLSVARSFLQSGFHDRSQHAISRARQSLSRIQIDTAELRAVAAEIESVAQRLELSTVQRSVL